MSGIPPQMDKFIIVAMAQNGPGFDLDDIQRVMDEKNNFVKDRTINWDAYFEDKQDSWDDRVKKAKVWTVEGLEIFWNNWRTGGDDYDTKFVLDEFYAEANTLQERGYYLPENLDTQQIENLIEGNPTNGEE